MRIDVLKMIRTGHYWKRFETVLQVLYVELGCRFVALWLLPAVGDEAPDAAAKRRLGSGSGS